MLFEAKVKVKIESDNGKTTKKTFTHLVHDEAISAVEEQITKVYTGSVNDWELVSVKETKVVSIIENGKEVIVSGGGE